MMKGLPVMTRPGHCEFFASATVLLLRAAGLPARYARGYSVHEFSKLEQRYLVRDRHAHAWALVYLDGAWHDVDTTPGSWVEIETAAASGWQYIGDLWSWGGFNLSQAMRWLRQRMGTKLWLWIFLPLAIFSARRYFFRKRMRRPGLKKVAAVGAVQKAVGLESEFYLIEKALVQAGFARRPSESMANWIANLPPDQLTAPLAEDLKSLLDLHYRHRFDPGGISAADKSRLASGTRLWLSEYRKSSSE